MTNNDNSQKFYYLIISRHDGSPYYTETSPVICSEKQKDSWSNKLFLTLFPKTRDKKGKKKEQ